MTEPSNGKQEEEQEREEEPLPTDSEVPNLEQLPEDEQPEKADALKEVAEAEAEAETEAEAKALEAPEPGEPGTEATEAAPTPPAAATPPKTEEELALERQLADVQKQLAALSSLPSTIQSTLDAVTKQLADLLPTFKLQQQQSGQEQDQDQEKDGNQPQIDGEPGENGQEAEGEPKPEDAGAKTMPRSTVIKFF